MGDDADADDDADDDAGVVADLAGIGRGLAT